MVVSYEFQNGGLNHFLCFKIRVEKFFDRHIKMVQSDWGGECRKLSTLFIQKWIIHRLSRPRIHDQIGAVERKHNHIVKRGLTTRPFLHSSHLLGSCSCYISLHYKSYSITLTQ